MQRELVKSMSIVVRRSLEIDGASYIESQHGTYVPRDGVGWMGQGSEWQGVALQDVGPGPAFAWTFDEKTRVLAEPKDDAVLVRTAARRERVALLEPDAAGSPRFWRVGDGEWISAKSLKVGACCFLR